MEDHGADFAAGLGVIVTAADACDAHVRLGAENCPGVSVAHGVKVGGFIAVFDDHASLCE